MKLNPAALAAFRDHVLSEYPKEACGVIVNFNYYPCKNVAAEPSTHFKISSTDYFEAEKNGPVTAILHSHPYDKLIPQKYPPVWPSGKDMETWMKGKIPWGIAATEGEGLTDLVWLEDEVQPLIGREFIHGIHDCYSLCRDYYKLIHNISLPNYARDMRWWKKGLDLYTENFELAGFYEIPLSQAKYGDAFLIQYGSRVINHAAIYYGENTLLDHIAGRLSVLSPLSGMAPYIKKAVRHKDLNKETE